MSKTQKDLQAVFGIEEEAVSEVTDTPVATKKVKVGGFRVEPLEKTTEETDRESLRNKQAMEEDFEFVRRNIKTLTETGLSTLNDMTDLARDSEEIKSGFYDSISSMLKTIADSQKTLMEMHDKRQNFDKKSKTNPIVNNDKSVQNTNNFFGTAKDLQDEIEKMKKKLEK